MEETYTEFMQSAGARVQSAYAKRLLSSLAARSGGDNLFADAAELLHAVFADVLTVRIFSLCLCADSPASRRRVEKRSGLPRGRHVYNAAAGGRGCLRSI